jgi:3-hydroxybutyryl-CoA dehydrogenase
MKIVVSASDNQWEELTAHATDTEWVKAHHNFSFLQYDDADAFFILQECNNINYAETTKLIFINSVSTTLKELDTAFNVFRINGWNTFLSKSVWEIAGVTNESCNVVLKSINKKAIWVKDEPGLVSARIITMIINEAYFTLNDAVSSKAEIDIAMKLGTNYPCGPFEWAEKIGLNNIYFLLQKLSLTDKRYQPASMLATAAKQY